MSEQLNVLDEIGKLFESSGIGYFGSCIYHPQKPTVRHPVRISELVLTISMPFSAIESTEIERVRGIYVDELIALREHIDSEINRLKGDKK